MRFGAGRRNFFTGTTTAIIGALLDWPAIAWPQVGSAASSLFQPIEAESGGRVGVMAVDTGSGRTLGSRSDERFAMCSTFKWLLAAAILARVDARQLSLNKSVSVRGEPPAGYAPVTSKPPPSGRFTLEALCAAAVEDSDNTAANVLLKQIDGPAGLTHFLRSIGDDTTRLDRNEPSLNSNLPNDDRDTTTPRAMAATMNTLLLGKVLSSQSRERLVAWMKLCHTGQERLRAGLPADWLTGDKTGTGVRGAVNDLAITWPPGKPPILMVAYLSDSSLPVDSLSKMHVRIAKLVAETFFLT